MGLLLFYSVYIFFNLYSLYIENEVIKVVLPKDATGKVSTTINGKEYSANVNNGAANIIVSGLNHGNYEIGKVYLKNRYRQQQ